MLSLLGIPVPLTGMLITRQITSAENAWRGAYYSVRLVDPLQALRVHVRGGGVASNPQLAFGAGTIGRWFAIGDVILSRSDYGASYAIPAAFTTQDGWILPPDTVINVGIASTLFDHSGGGVQVERLSGPVPEKDFGGGYWLDTYGRA
jgi:hypothetical protein